MTGHAASPRRLYGRVFQTAMVPQSYMLCSYGLGHAADCCNKLVPGASLLHATQDSSVMPCTLLDAPLYDMRTQAQPAMPCKALPPADRAAQCSVNQKSPTTSWAT